MLGLTRPNNYDATMSIYSCVRHAAALSDFVCRIQTFSADFCGSCAAVAGSITKLTGDTFSPEMLFNCTQARTLSCTLCSRRCESDRMRRSRIRAYCTAAATLSCPIDEQPTLSDTAALRTAPTSHRSQTLPRKTETTLACSRRTRDFNKAAPLSVYKRSLEILVLQQQRIYPRAHRLSRIYPSGL